MQDTSQHEQISHDHSQDIKTSSVRWKFFTALIVFGLVVFFEYLYSAKQQTLKTSEELVQLNPNFQEETNADIKEIQEMLVQNPGDTSLMRGLALKYYALGDYQKAKETLEQAIVVDPNDALSYSVLGDVLKDMGDLVVAEENYKKAIARDPSYAPTYTKLIDFYKSQDRTEELEKLYLDAIENTQDSFLMKQYAIFLEGQGNYQGAIDYWKLALEQEDENAELIQAEIERLEKLQKGQ